MLWEESCFQLDELVAVLMTQVRPYDHLNFRADFQSLVNAAVFE